MKIVTEIEDKGQVEKKVTVFDKKTVISDGFL
jgi:hypothetical protein